MIRDEIDAWAQAVVDRFPPIPLELAAELRALLGLEPTPPTAGTADTPADKPLIRTVVTAYTHGGLRS